MKTPRKHGGHHEGVRRTALFLCGCAAGAFLLGVACGDRDSYVYTARKYDPVADCLEPYTAVEVVSGDHATVTCDPTCLTVGKDTVVSVVCPPFPAIATPLEQDAADCIAALRVFDAAACGALSGDAGDASTSDASDDATPGEDASDAARDLDSGTDADQ